MDGGMNTIISLPKRAHKLFLYGAVLVLSFCPAEPMLAQVQTASVSATCRSLSQPAVTHYVPGIGSVTTYTATFDGAPGVPVHQEINGGYFTSNELRPRAGQTGVYEADYINYSPIQGAVDYGFGLMNLPTTDVDGNGVPDFLQFNMPANYSFTGTITSENPSASVWRVKGMAAKVANSIATSYAYTTTSTSPGASSESLYGTWQTFYLSGAASYVRGAQNQITLEVAQRTDGGTSSSFVGTTSFTVDTQNQISLSQMALKETGGFQVMTIYPSTLRRSGRKYIGNAEIGDGELQTNGRDFTQWVIEIEDNNDSNRNGVPDLSDALLTASVQVRIGRVGKDVVLTWPVAATGYVLEGAESFKTPFTPVNSAAVVNTDKQVLSTSLPASSGKAFYRLRHD